MKINPFKESNLDDLQQSIITFLTDHFGETVEKIKKNWRIFVKKGNERLTVMFIPHSEKKIINFQVSLFAISGFIAVVGITVLVTSILIIDHSSTIKEISKLKSYGSNSQMQIEKYREEVARLKDIFQSFKPELAYLYSLTPDSNADNLWAKGGPANPNPENVEEAEPLSEILDIQEIETELRVTKKIVGKIKDFLNYRKKIIENTPSIWPVNGYIISRFGSKNHPYSFKYEYHAGIDIEAFPGSEIRATAPGTVESVRWDPNLGLTITITHRYGFTTQYSHCERVLVKNEQKVSKGEVIAYIGKTGRTTKHICYYKIKIGTEYVDPIPFLNRMVP
jgi:murein DD-endopeptidase MepM/ murein hydrolase activator NlpD